MPNLPLRQRWINRFREVEDRLKETLREIRNRTLIAAGSEDRGNDPALWYQLINDVEVVDHIQNAEATTARQAVRHEVQRPPLVRPLR